MLKWTTKKQLLTNPLAREVYRWMSETFGGLFVVLLVAVLVAGCVSGSPTPERMTVRGVLQHFPSDVRSAQAWYGHNFIVGSTPILPTDNVPKEVLKEHVGKHVVITGIWDPGQAWEPDDKELNLPMPVDPEKEVIIRGDGLEASSLTVVEK